MLIPRRSFSWLESWIPTALGSSRVCVELEPGDIETAIVSALLWYEATFGGLEKRMTLAVTDGIAAYVLGADVECVSNVIFPGTGGGFRVPFPEIPPSYQGFPSVISGETSSYVQELQALEAEAQVYNWEPSWEYWRPTRTLTLTTPPPTAGTAIVEYLSTDLDASQFTAKDWLMLRDWALAEAKEILGRVRGKWQGLPVPGGERSLDGEAILLESQAEKERLRNEAKERFTPVGFMIG